MNDMEKYHPNMPATLKREMDARMNQILQIASSTKVAMEVNKSVHEHGWFTLISSINQAKFTLQAYQQNYPDDTAENALQKWQNDFEADINRIYAILGDKLVKILENIPTEPQQVGFWEELGSQILLLLSDQSSQLNSIPDQMMQLETQAKRALMTTADQYTQKLSGYRETLKHSLEVNNEPQKR